MSRRALGWAIISGLAFAAVAFGCSSSKNGYQTGPSGGGGGLELSSGNVAPSAAFAHTFNTAGTYRYHCTYHAQMLGAVVVVPSGGSMASGVSITNYAFSPETTQVNVGGTVTWTNNAFTGSPPYVSGTTHTVTTY